LDISFELRSECLWLIRNFELGHADVCFVRFQNARQHLNESRFTSSILAQHHDALRVTENTFVDCKLECSKGLSHGGVSVLLSICGILILLFQIKVEL